MQLCCGVERSVYVCCCISIGAFCARLTPAVCRVRAKQDGLRQAAFLFRAGRDRLSMFSDGAGLSCILGLLQVCPFLYGDPDGERSEPRIRKGTPCWGAFLLIWFTLRYDTAGRTLGAARPQTCAKESLTLWTLFMWGAVEYLFAQAHWPCDAFRGENAGAEMWKPHCGLSGLSSLDSRQSTSCQPRNNCHPRIAARTPRSTRVYGKT